MAGLGRQSNVLQLRLADEFKDFEEDSRYRPYRPVPRGLVSLRDLAWVWAGCIALQPSRAHAQWWSRGPADFEECADIAEKAASKEARTSALAECNAKFAGRRKPGGGYTYFDFMQNRSFDIAGPNPTPQEQKHIDEQYTDYLDRQRRSTIAAEQTAKQQLEPAVFRNETEKTP